MSKWKEHNDPHSVPVSPDDEGYVLIRKDKDGDYLILSSDGMEDEYILGLIERAKHIMLTVDDDGDDKNNDMKDLFE